MDQRPENSIGYATGKDMNLIRTNINNIDYSMTGTMYRRPQLKPSIYEHNMAPKATANEFVNVPYEDDDDDIIPNWVPLDRVIEKVLTTFDYEGLRGDELSFKENTFIYVIKKNDDHWYEGIMQNEMGEVIQGLYPYNYAKCVKRYVEESRITQC